MDRYIEELRELVDWIKAYADCSLTGTSIAAKLGVLVRLPKKRVGKDPSDQLDYMRRVDTMIYDVFKHDHDFKRISVPDFFDDKQMLADFMALSEIARFREIKSRGYYSMYKEFDEREVGTAFYKQTNMAESLNAFSNAVSILSEDIDNVMSMRGVPDSVIDLYSAIRELSTHAPDRLNKQGEFLSDKYLGEAKGVLSAKRYLERMDNFVQKLQVVASDYKIDTGLSKPGEVDVEMEILDERIDEYMVVIRQVHSKLVYANILRVI